LQYLQPVGGIGSFGRRHGLDLLIVAVAIEGAIGVLARGEARWLAAPAVAVVVLALLFRRAFPFAAAAAVFLLAPAFSFVDGRVMTSTFSVYAVGLAAAALLGNLRDALEARIGLVIVVIGSAIIVGNKPEHGAADLVFVPGVFAIAWLAGYALRARASETEAAEQRAAHAEQERETAARIAVAEERARIARELHDIVAHSVSVMVLQVGAVRHNLPEALADDKAALQSVERAGRAALAEMRQLLGAMRDSGSDVDRAPQPGLDDLAALVEEIGRAGLPVRLHVEGDRATLPRAIELSAYRIVQEGLTNSLKHARASRADVTVDRRTDGVKIEVRDDGVGAAARDGLGHGLVGVRERVKIYGGEMSAGPAPGGGFVLTASMPVDNYQP
jgi:signal transduction histidine kinase